MPANDGANSKPTPNPAGDAQPGTNGPRPPAPHEAQPEQLKSSRLEAQREMLALVATQGELNSSRYEPRDLPSAITLARMIATSPLCPMALRGREADVLLVMMTGAEIGLTTMQSLRNIYVVEGRIGMSAALIRGRCQKHAECELFEIAEADGAHAVVEVKKRGWSERRLVSWSLEDAERAGLLKDDRPDSLWQRWPQEMCVARATTRAASMYFPDITAGLLSEEELRDVTVTALVPGASPGSSTPPSVAPAGGVLPRVAPGMVMQPSHAALDAFAAAGAPGSPSHGSLSDAVEEAHRRQPQHAPRSATTRKPPKRADRAARKPAVSASPPPGSSAAARARKPAAGHAAGRNGRPAR
jgi:hypothetical protein